MREEDKAWDVVDKIASALEERYLLDKAKEYEVEEQAARTRSADTNDALNALFRRRGHAG